MLPSDRPMFRVGNLQICSRKDEGRAATIVCSLSSFDHEVDQIASARSISVVIVERSWNRKDVGIGGAQQEIVSRIVAVPSIPSQVKGEEVWKHVSGLANYSTRNLIVINT